MKLKLYKIKFEPIYPVGCCLIISAENKEQVEDIAIQTLQHTKNFIVEEIELDKPKVIIYMSGDY